MTDYTDTTTLWLTGRKKEIRDDLLHTGVHDFRSTCNRRNSKRLTVMNELIKHADHTIDTQELLKMVNDARKTCGESPVRNNKFIEKVLDELDGEDGYTKSATVPQGGGTPMVVITMNYKQAMRVAARESKAVRRALIDKLEELSVKQHVPQPLLQLQCEIGELHKQNDELRNEIEVDRKTYDLLLVDMKKLWEEKENLQKELTALRKQDDVRKRALKLLLGL